MNKVDIIIFASIYVFSFCYIVFFNNNNNSSSGNTSTSRKKIDREIDETIKRISEYYGCIAKE